MKAFKVISDPEAFQLLADETRRRVIYLLRAKEMTVSQIAGELSLTPQAIYHHIRKLRDAGMVEVAREERVDHFIETYYRATAEVFNMSHGQGGSTSFHETKTTEALQALAKLGFQVRTDPQVVSKIVETQREMGKIGEKDELSNRIGALEDVDFFVKQEVAHLAQLLTMSEKEFNEYMNLVREHRKLVQSLIEQPAVVARTSRKG